MKKNRYLKWVFKKDNLEENKVLPYQGWEPKNNDWSKRGGFNFTNEECALRWMSRGDILYEVVPNCGDNFDLIYKEIISYCKDLNKTIVIDCAQFHCIKDINILKGKIIAIRTSINTCYERVVKRFIEQKENYIEEELIKYQDRKKTIFKWYKFTNIFLEKINNLL